MASAQGQLEPEQPRRIEILTTQLLIQVDLYKAHFDIFLKGTALYLGLVGTVVGLALQSKVDRRTMFGLSILLAVVSIIGFVGGTISRQWIRATQRIVIDVCETLQIAPVPLESADRIVIMEQSISVAVLIAASVAAIGLA